MLVKHIESVAIWDRALSPNEILFLTVPEPTTLGMLGIVGAIACARRSRRGAPPSA